jgi:hypothetical protein
VGAVQGERLHQGDDLSEGLRSAAVSLVTTRGAVASLVAAALLIGACTAEDDLADAPDEPAVEAPTAPAPPPHAEPDTAPPLTTPRPPDVVLDVDVARLTSSSVRDVVTPWYERLGVEPTVALASIPAARRDPARDAGLGTLRITDRIERLAGECRVEIRSIEGIDLGADGSARIHATLEVMARRSLLDVAWVRGLADRPCGSEDRPAVYQEVAEVACGIPDGRPYRCIVITTHATGADPIVDHAVVDVRSGKVVDLAEIVAQVGGSGGPARRQVTRLVCERIGTTEVREPLGEDEICPPLPDRLGLLPAADGLTVVMQGLHWRGAWDELHVAWEGLTYGRPAPLHAPPRAEDVKIPEPRPTPEVVLARAVPDPWFHRLGIDRRTPMDRIPAELADPALPEGLGPLRVTGAVQRARHYCAAELRHVVGVDAGPGTAAARIGADLVAVAREFLRSAQWITGFGEDWCLDHGDRRPWSYQELSEERCELPGGPDVRCFTLTQWTYHEGEGGAPFELDQSVFDTRTGRRLSIEQVLAIGTGDVPGGGAAALARARQALCRERFPRGVTDGSRPCPEVPLTRAQPTADGVWFGFTGREDLWILSDRHIEAFVPWEELRG